MACFIVSAVEAVAVSAAKKVEEKKEKREEEAGAEVKAYHIPFSRKLGWLSKMLWGGAFLLLIEHIWHGEVVPWFPFLTAMESKEETITMLKEMATVGFSMAGLITAVWIVMLLVASSIEKKAGEIRKAEKQ
ncbi:MAG: hypothetical protein K6C35_08605 [Eubacterium sp.]|nr:hypothetical protein [Eubacterium sp.]SEF76535.1 hypothetical protein SAMN04487934_10352 [Eubacterium ruminantium]